MLDEDELAFRLFTADTGDASRLGWAAFGNRDKYERMARVAIQFLRTDEGTRRRLTDVEERLVLKSLRESGEVLYDLPHPHS
ncbi:hypothetical protein IVB03_39620 [Bradyrhizobium sp. 168]|uniref:hypothetical protein n=1 Tax=Bradyrhizobium sp. 168 TaxID=2782639 RepID=UPI001FF8B1EC|nr:hypothetical protein [Bradyrhizobium sp. 168]MCK1585506.1 hypothetical protein [Bradyrhizobium sp. 168]